MKKKNKKGLLIAKLIIVATIIFLLSGAGVMAMSTKAKDVKIVLSNGYEMTILTNKNNVGDILKENNILVKSDEKVIPAKTEKLTEERSIRILNKAEQEIEISKVSESGIETSVQELLQAYDTIVEKIVVVQEEIPFETITKDVSNGAESTNKVIQEGKNGIKEVTYKVKYQNNTEIEKTKIDEKVIEEPVNKIIQVNAVIVTSRSSNGPRSGSTSTNGSNVEIYKVTAYCPCSKCCGRYASGYTSSGTKATAGRTIATSSKFAFGTKLKINGKIYTVEDRGGAIQGNKIDIYMDTHAEALAWGVKYLPVEVVN